MTISNADDKREIEFKFRVDGPEAFDALTKASASRPGRMVTQKNHFFDTASRDLHRQKYTLRLREESGGVTLTAKGPDQQSADGTLTSRAEEEIALASAEAHAVLNGEKNPLNVLDQRADPRSRELLDAIRAIVAGKHLEHVGMFENDRMRLPVTLNVGDENVPVVFEMDRTRFPFGQVHYEVEVELKIADHKAVQQALHRLFETSHVAWRTGPSKAKRFFDAASGKAI